MNTIFKQFVLLPALVVLLSGCVTSSSFTPYTAQPSPPKPDDYFVPTYPPGQAPGPSHPYWVVGRLEVEGYASDGVDGPMLTRKAQKIARKKGADAIINTTTEMLASSSFYRYIPYGDMLLIFRGDLIVFAPEPNK